ncbi:serine hydrolase family protein [Aquincola sp. S2]|uniref:Serine hydrolase family protein n=1 Tax=Pseudaquabacterium terrae TaxID=2732868 RepID=A0ABX2EF44_9BURK|nr:alpha/beta hydrolase [Aquabacterium terrae]NRF67223.1 serine hydrolase family protein [Aquabacterium terrae]
MDRLPARPTVLIVPGLRDAVPGHWQTLLAEDLDLAGWPVANVPPMGRENLDCAARIDAIEVVAQAIDGPIVVVAHSGGCVMVAHWAQRTRREVQGAVLATPPDFERPMPDGYPTLAALREGGWLPLPRLPLPFDSLVIASRNDPLASFERTTELARCWNSRLVDMGDVGHLNPASGYGRWPLAQLFIEHFSAAPQGAA